MVNRIHYQRSVAPPRNRCAAALLDLLPRGGQHRMDRGRGKMASQELAHPPNHLALTQPAHGQREQHLIEGVTLVALQQRNLGLAPQPRHAHLGDRTPQRLPTLAHGIAPAINLLAAPPVLGHLLIALGLQQPFDAALEQLPHLAFDLPPGLLANLPQC